MAPFRHERDELEHGLPWLLMQNGPITKYLSRPYFEEDVEALRHLEFAVTRFDCKAWADEPAMFDALTAGLRLPNYTGQNFDALADSLSDAPVPERTGMVIALDNFDEAPRPEILLSVFADASRYWLLFGRLFMVVVRTDDAAYEGPHVGGGPPNWNRREWPAANRT